MMSITANRFHDFSAGHRVLGHEGACAHLHGHNYRVHFECLLEGGGTDSIGRVVDFGVIKRTLCEWLEENWDHKMLIYVDDPWYMPLKELDPSVVGVPFIPTAENMAMHLLYIVGPEVLVGSGVILKKVIVEETRKCAAAAER